MTTPAEKKLKLTLYAIEDSLQQLMELRDEAIGEGDAQGLAIIEGEITAYLTKEAAKVDSYAQLIRLRQDAGEMCRREADRLDHRAKALEADVARLKQMASEVMQEFGIRVLETPTNKLRVCGNGGVQPLEVDEPAIQSEYLNATVTMNAGMLMKILREMMEMSNGMGLHATAIRAKTQFQPDTERIREALKQRIPCPECKGKGHDASATAERCETCPRCDGRGTVPNTVPGARLLPRGSHVRVE